MRQIKQPLWWTLGLLLLIELVILYRLQGPPPKNADASLDEFSAARAVAVLTRILGDESPHPTGSPANDRVRDRLVTELHNLGLEVEVQPSHRPAAGAPVLRNVLAHLPRTSGAGRPLVLATHFVQEQALARAIAGSDEIDLQASAEDAVFFDVRGTFVVYCPQSWALPLGAIAFVILALSGARSLRTQAGVRAVCCTLLAMFVAALLSAALGWVVARSLIAAGLLPRYHVAQGRWISALYRPLSFAILWFAVRYVVRGVSRAHVWATYWLVWSIAGLAIAWWRPGFCDMLLVPALAAAMFSMVPIGWTARLVLSVGIAGMMLLPLGNMLPIVFGPGAGVLLCPVFTFVLSPLFPCLVAAGSSRSRSLGR